MKDTNNKQRKIISVFYEEYRKKILTEFDFEAVVNGAMVETIDGRQVKIDKIDKEKRRIYGFIYNKDMPKWGHELWWDENGYILGWENIETYTGRESLAILNYGSLVKNKVKKGDCNKIIKPFNLDAVRKGAQMETKEGNRVILDGINDKPNKYGEILCGLEQRRTGSSVYWWCADGRKFKNEDNDRDLVIVEYVQIREDKPTVKSIDIDGLRINLS